MGKTKKILMEKHIIKRFKVREFREIPRHRLIDIVPSIIASRPKEMAILTSWEKHFRDLNIPHVITEMKVNHTTYGEVDIRTLWKEDVVERRL